MHLNERDTKALASLATGIPRLQLLNQSAVRRPCTACLQGKQTAKVNRKPQRQAKEPLELIHSDLGDLSKEKTPSLSGSRYFILFIDDYTRFTWVYFLKSKGKGEVLQAFKDFKALVEKQTGRKIKRFHCDNGRGEYANDPFKQFLKEEGISNEPCPPHQHWYNGVAERKIRMVDDAARCLLMQAKLPS